LGRAFADARDDLSAEDGCAGCATVVAQKDSRTRRMAGSCFILIEGSMGDSREWMSL
jgi:hypothetical protein